MNTAIALVFYTLYINGPATTTGPTISERLFDSHQECAEFVNTIAQQDVVDENYEFEFATIDGILFKGGCYNEEQFGAAFANPV